jgi:hypothetical protein
MGSDCPQSLPFDTIAGNVWKQRRWLGASHIPGENKSNQIQRNFFLFKLCLPAGSLLDGMEAPFIATETQEARLSFKVTTRT